MFIVMFTRRFFKNNLLAIKQYISARNVTLAMNAYRNKMFWKAFIIISATLIGCISLYYTNELARSVAAEEQKRMQIWAEATQQMAISENEKEISFCLEIIRSRNVLFFMVTPLAYIQTLNDRKNAKSDRNTCSAV